MNSSNSRFQDLVKDLECTRISRTAKRDRQLGWSRKYTGRRCGQGSNTWILLHYLVTFCFIQASCQMCDFPSTVVFSLLETDPAGTEILNVSSWNRTHAWNYSTGLWWLPEFLNFTLDDTDLYYHLRLTQELDLEYIFYNLNVTEISTFSLELVCQAMTVQKKEIFLIVQAVNEFDPEFNTSSIELWVMETLAINSQIINLTNWASDRDVNPLVREIASFSFLPYFGDPQIDGHRWLQMLIAYDGLVVLKAELDYETLPEATKFIQVGVSVKDQGGRTGTASLTVNVEDDDDLPPEFTYPGCGSPCAVAYTATISPNFTGPVINIKPAPIYARDRDTLNYPVEYRFVQVTNNYDRYVGINSTNGQVTILHEIGAADIKFIILVVEAREVSLLARSEHTTLFITVDGGKTQESPYSSSSDNNTTIIIVATILGVVVLFVVVLLVAFIVYYRKRDKKTVHPEDQLKMSQAGLPKENDVKDKSLLITPEAHLFKRKDSNSTAPGREYNKPPAAPLQTTHMSKVPENKRSHSSDRNSPGAPENSGPATVDKDQVMPTSDGVSTALATGTGEENQVTSTDQDKNSSLTGPKLNIVSGLVFQDKSEEKETQSSAVDERKDVETERRDVSDTDATYSSGESGIHNSASSTEPAPYSKKSARRRMKTPPRREEDGIYDGTKDVEEINLDSGFYTDSTKKRIKRSSRTAVIIPDPSDTRYWISVNDKY